MTRAIGQRMSVAAVVAAISLTAASAQSSSARSNAAPQGYRVAGTVVNATTGEPVRGAALSLITIQDSLIIASTESGDDGRFQMDSLSAAKFMLMASKRGYTTSTYNQHFEYSSAIVTGADQDTEHLVFKLSPAGVIYGVVTGDGGDPVEGASVMLYERPHRHVPGERILQVQTLQTDDTGAYEFAGLEPGGYLIAVKARPWYAMNRDEAVSQSQETEAQTALDVAYPVTYFDSTTDESSAGTIDLAAGAREEADISLHAVPALHLSVQSARRFDGGVPRIELVQTIFGVEVSGEGFGNAQPAGGQSVSINYTGVAPGHYELTQGDPPRMVELDAASSQQVDPTAGVPTQNISGIVQTAPGVPYTGRGVIVLESADGTERPMPPAPIENGSFKLFNVPAGSWLVEAAGQETQLPVLAIGPREGRAQAGNRITVEDKPLSPVVTVSAGNLRLEGFTRKDGKGVAGAMVILVPKDIAEIAELARRDQSDSDGSFALLNVAPGDYTLVAIEDAWGMDWFDPAVITRYLPHGMAVTVKDKSEKTQHLAEPVLLQAR